MSQEDVDAYLKALDTGHNPASVSDDGFGKLPDGDYQVRLDKIYISRSKSSNTMQCVFEFEVINGDHAFRKIVKYSRMDATAGLDFLTRDLRKMGIDNFTWSTVQQQFPKVLDKLYAVTLKLKTKDSQTFQSVYINSALNQDQVMVTKERPDVPF